ncbi:hypothetical protein [Pseudonocardia sp. NPDC049635]|uniref:hypothetical protein n=1 Tax=Pseudonocardia sp. NPDC049635 TaxID=3155506 RepID=UPI0033ED9077
MAFSLGARDRVTTLPKVNRRALRKYGEFWRALQLVGDAEAEKLTAKTRDAERRGERKNAKGVSAKAGVTARHAWSRASGEEMSAAAKKAHRSLQVMSASAKRWEAELVSREWRK